MSKSQHQLFQGLMFLQGHVARPDTFDDRFAPLGNRGASAQWFDRTGTRRAGPAEGAKAAPGADATCVAC